MVAPESDDNPWHYKISWNPRNVVLAGKAGAVYKEDGREVQLGYEQLFTTDHLVQVPGLDTLAYYANRDSLSYAALYNLQHAETFLRTTLRYPDFCAGWKNIVDLRLTDEEKIYDTNGLSIAAFFKQHFDTYHFNQWLNNLLSSRLSYVQEMMENLTRLMDAEEQALREGADPEENFMVVDEKGELSTVDLAEVKDKAAETVALKMHEANTTMKQLLFLGLDDEETLINKGLCSAADVLQFILETKLALQPHDKDLIVMLHEITFTLLGVNRKINSSLVVKGEDHLRTAMAKTVGLPLGIAARLLLEGKILARGLHIPIIPAIYEPVLKELANYGIAFTETDEA